MKQDLTPAVFLLFIQPAIKVSAFLFVVTSIAGAIFDGHDIHYKSLILKIKQNL